MKGQLHEHPLAELLREIRAAGLTGALRLERERAKVVLYFEDGEIIYATCNLRVFRLAECLRRWGTVPEEQLSAAGGRATDMQLAQALFAGGVLDLQAIKDLWTRQASEVLRPALLWTDGSWTFDPRVRLAEEIRVTVETDALSMESARRLPPEFSAGRLANEDEKLSHASNNTNGFALLPQEAYLLSRLSGPLTVRELTAHSGLPVTEALHLIYTLALGNFLARERWPNAFSDEDIQKALAFKAAAARAAANGDKTTEAETGKDRTAEEKTAVAAETEVDEQSELESFLARVDAAVNYYQALDVSPRAEMSEIKRAYHSLAKRFHPDRFHQGTNASLRGRIEGAFARLAQAYETLKDKQTRAAYDLKLEKRVRAAHNQPSPASQRQQQSQTTQASQAETTRPQMPSGPSVLEHAEKQFKRGLTAIEHGNQALALACFSEAARLAPKQALYRAHYGHTLASQEQSRHQAEAELQAAIALDTRNISYRVMLAELYRHAGLLKRAQGELERALSIDPQHKQARQILKSMKGRD
jgi:tetratricopeptide (TPR) repeat protein